MIMGCADGFNLLWIFLPSRPFYHLDQKVISRNNEVMLAVEMGLTLFIG